jgi:octanoyl-[GcvH]:protein N-octanoyltransferase
VVPESVLSRVRLAPANGVDDGLVLLDHLSDVAGLGQAQPPHAVQMPVGARDDVPRDRAAAQLAKGGVELVIELEEGAGIGGVPRGLLVPDDGAQPVDPRSVDTLGGQAHSGALERLAQELRVIDARDADAAHERAKLRHDLDQLVVAQPRQRLAHGRATDAEPVGDLVLGDLAAWLELSRDDRVPQGLVDGEACTTAVGARDPGESACCDICILAYQLPTVNVSPTPMAGSATADQSVSRSLLDQVAAGHLDGAIRIWAPEPGLAMSRLDELRPGAEAARRAAEAAGFPTIRRLSGGHAVVLGPGSFCVGFAEPAVTFERTQERYERLTAALLAALGAVGIDAERGELAREWCPGAWSISARGVKLAGLAQRAIKGAAWAEAVVDLAPDKATREVLGEVYAELRLDLDPATIGSVSELRGDRVAFDELAQPLLAALTA